MLTRRPSVDWLEQHRRAWTRKPGVRIVYTDWFRRLHAACVPEHPVVELGCGAGFFKALYPHVIATDALPNPYADRIVDATVLPFADASVANLVMLDVFHHLPEPETFVREAVRCLRPGGRLVMIEPWVSLLGRMFFRYVHHEICDLAVDPAAPWAAEKDPMDGNVALPYLYFRSGGHVERLDARLRVIRREPFAALPWLLSGGFQPLSLLPVSLAPGAMAIDRLISRIPSFTATRCLIVIEKECSES